MSYIRLQIDLAVKQPTSPVITAEFSELLRLIRNFKFFSSKINPGQPNEENTLRATYHICHHDEEGLPCESEKDI